MPEQSLVLFKAEQLNWVLKDVKFTMPISPLKFLDLQIGK